MSTSLNLAQSMFDKYGPLLTIDQLAQILDRTVNGVRVALGEQRPEPYAQQLNAHKVHIGRRVYFKTLGVAQLIG
jgi:hypothetical protein